MPVPSLLCPDACLHPAACTLLCPAACALPPVPCRLCPNNAPVHSQERMRIAGEREREKLLRLAIMEEEELARAAHDKEMRMKKMQESEAKREAEQNQRKDAIAAANAAKRDAVRECTQRVA